MPADTTTEEVINESVLASVKLWTKRIRDARKFYEKDFVRMRENMEFAAGLQWPAQDEIQSAKYVANFVNHEVNQKVSNLYAKNPKAIYTRRARLDFQIWDGSVETMQSAHATVAQAMQAAGTNPALAQQVMGNPQVLAARALLSDIDTGKQWQKLCDRIGKTLEILYGYQCDTSAPSFKYLMKQLVRRVVTTGVGYVRLNFSRDGEDSLIANSPGGQLSMRVKRAKEILSGINDDEITDSDPRREQLEQLFTSIEHSVVDGDQTDVQEKLDFDFPPSDSIIFDTDCTSVKGFIGARWVVQEYIKPLEDVNAYFETSIDAGGELVKYRKNGTEVVRMSDSKDDKDPQEKPLVCLWEVFDILTKTTFFLVDGYKDYVQEPEAVTPAIMRFWPIFGLTFNDVEVVAGSKIRVFPPSDVELIRHAQQDWNTSRNELRKHRKSNRPWYGTRKGTLTDADKAVIGNHESGQLLELEGIPPGEPVKNYIEPYIGAPIVEGQYDTAPYLEDTSLCIGTNNVQQQQGLRHVAATPAVIQEQSRVAGANSNVDDLDDLLSELAQAGGEMMLREFSLTTVKRIVGRGAAWPEQNRQDFLNEIFLDSQAASSGRPNKAVDVANAQQLVPLLLQAGANPWGVISKIVVPALDTNLDVNDFAPMVPPQMTPSNGQHPTGGQNKPPVAQPATGMGVQQGAQ